jgi:hypothetical protein
MSRSSARLDHEPGTKVGVLAAGGADRVLSPLPLLHENEGILVEAHQADFKSGFAQRTLLMYASCTKPVGGLVTQ